MKITVLSENTTRGPKATPEFGLSLHIACGSQSILFDSGSSDNFSRNARVLGIDEKNIYAFGDQWNDVMMTANAAHGYGMLGSLCAVTSRFVTRLSCEEFGVADVLEREILNK